MDRRQMSVHGPVQTAASSQSTASRSSVKWKMYLGASTQRLPELLDLCHLTPNHLLVVFKQALRIYITFVFYS